MNRIRLLTAALVTIGVATAMHVDWHVARPADHHLSLGWRFHWLLALPVFGLSAWYVARAWPERLVGASIAIIGTASLLAAGLEPAWEYLSAGASLEWAFGRLRLQSFFLFLATGIATHTLVLGLIQRAARSRDSAARHA